MSVRRRNSALAPAVRATLDSLESRLLFAEIAETLLVDVDATNLPAGPAPSVVNAGTLGGVFEARDPATTPVIAQPLAASTTGTVGLRLDGNDFMQLYQTLGGDPLLAPAGITGPNPTHSVEAWVWNPGIAGEETVISWGKRGGPDGTNASFNYGSDARWGALGRWGAPDIGWGPTVPSGRQWHHLAWTYDGSTQRVYVDGVLANSELNAGEGGAGALNTYPDTPVLIGAQTTATNTVEPGLRGTLTIGKVRVHDGVLTPEQILANYNTEKAGFVEPNGQPPPPPPATLLVDVNATALPEGPATSIPNSGPAGGFFEAKGTADMVPVVGLPLEAATTGTRGIRMDGNDFLQHVESAGGALKPAPESLVGVDPETSVEVWVWNPNISDEETVVAWGRRGGPDGTNASFNYGANGDYGAIGRWGSPDIGWGPTVPAARQWHHLVYTYDGLQTRVYADGVQVNSELLGEGALNTHAGTPITIGAQLTAAGLVEPGLRGSLTVGRLRVYEGVLTPEQVAANYAGEKAGYVEPGIPPPPDPVALTAPPVHRYSFNDPVGDASGDQITDSIGTAHGRVVGPVEGSTVVPPAWTGTRLALSGGPSTQAAYGDFPNQLVSKFGIENGGPGQVTLEGWVRHTGNQAWSRFLDFGFSTAGELEGPGPATGNGNSFLMLTAQVGADVATHRFELSPVAGSPNNRFLDVNSATFNTDLHFAITWQESTFDQDGVLVPGQLKLYEQGLEVAAFRSPFFMNELLDVNNWLGRSQFLADPNFQGEYDEFRVYNRVLTYGEVRGNFQAGADILTGGTPTISEVFIKGSGWVGQDNNPATTTFMEYLEAKGLGDDVMGYRLFGTGRTPPAANPEDIIPWINADQIVIRYATVPTGTGVPTPGTLTVAGRNPAASAYTVTSVTPVPGDARTFVLQLSKPLGGGNPATGAAPTAAENGDYVTLGVPGGGSAGSNFSLRMKVLQGDTDHLNEGAEHVVLARDYSEIKKKFFKDTDDVPAGNDTDYTAFHDVDASGSILARDYSEVKKRFFQSLPPPPPAAAGEMFSSARVADDVLR